MSEFYSCRDCHVMAGTNVDPCIVCGKRNFEKFSAAPSAETPSERPLMFDGPDAHAKTDALVTAAFAARTAGLERLCLTCLAGFNGNDCPKCVPPSEPVPTREMLRTAIIEAGTAWTGSREQVLLRMADAIFAIRSASAEGSSEEVRIAIAGLTQPQRIALEDLLATWAMLSGQGSSRWTAFYADGDGNFHPKILVNGKKPEFSPLVDRKAVWQGDEYRIDFDNIPAVAPPSVGDTQDQVADSSLSASQQGDDGESTSGSGNPPAREPDADADWLDAHAVNVNAAGFAFTDVRRKRLHAIAARLRASAAPAGTPRAVTEGDLWSEVRAILRRTSLDAEPNYEARLDGIAAHLAKHLLPWLASRSEAGGEDGQADAAVMNAIELTIKACDKHENDKTPHEARDVDYAGILATAKRAARDSRHGGSN